MTYTTAYYLYWLDERYRFDAVARNPTIEQKFLHSLPSKDTISLVDVGAGSGANGRYLMEKIPANQQWVLIEQNPDFSKASLQVLQQHARHQGYTSFLEQDTLTLQTPTKTIQVNAKQGSLLEIENMTDLSHTDAVVANAVFDLFTPHQFDTFVSTIARYQLIFLSTLNYENMHFSPNTPQDEKMIALYHAHMLRPQTVGTAMGPDCIPQISEILKKYRYAVDTGSSIWNIHSKDEKMMQYLLNFMESSITELPPSPEDALLLQQWVKQKEEAADFTLTIEHQDILGYF